MSEKVVKLRPDQIQPADLLRQALDNSDVMASVLIVVHWIDGRVSSEWSTMPVKDLAMAVLVAQKDAMDTIRDSERD